MTATEPVTGNTFFDEPVDCVVCGRPGLVRLWSYPPCVLHEDDELMCELPPRVPTVPAQKTYYYSARTGRSSETW